MGIRLLKISGLGFRCGLANQRCASHLASFHLWRAKAKCPAEQYIVLKLKWNQAAESSWVYDPRSNGMNRDYYSGPGWVSAMYEGGPFGMQSFRPPKTLVPLKLDSFCGILTSKAKTPR